jgi:hypothetical protein
MALVLADRVKETTTSTGTTAITLAGASTGYQTFSSAVGNANTTYYTIADQGGANWEVGIGTYTTSGNTLSRDTVLASSNAGSLVNFTAGTKDVFVTYPSGKAFWLSDVPLYTTNGGNGISSALSITAVNAVYTPVYVRASPRYIDINGTLILPNLSSKWVESVAYASDTRVTSLTYNDLEGTVGSFNPTSMAALTTLSAPVLTTVGGNFNPFTMAALTTLSIPALTTVASSFNTTSMASLTTLSAPALTIVGGSFTPGTMNSLTTLSFPALTTIGGSFIPSTMSSLTTLSFPALTTVGINFNPNTMAALTTISLSAIVSIGFTINISTGMAALNTFTLGSTLKSVGSNVSITSAALTQASVDSILVRLAALDGTNGTIAYSSKTVTITGTSATPSATGLAAKVILVARGCTVTTN